MVLGEQLIYADRRVNGRTQDQYAPREGEWRDFGDYEVCETASEVTGRHVDFRNGSGWNLRVTLVDGGLVDHRVGDIYVKRSDVYRSDDPAYRWEWRMPREVEDYLRQHRGYPEILDCYELEVNEGQEPMVWFNIGEQVPMRLNYSGS